MYPIDVTAEYGDGIAEPGTRRTGHRVVPQADHRPAAPAHRPELLTMVVGFVAWLGYWVVAFTGELPDFFVSCPSGPSPGSSVNGGLGLSLTDLYPPFEWEPVGQRVELATLSERAGPRSRGLAVLGILFFIKPIALIPHFFVLSSWCWPPPSAAGSPSGSILFTGRYPAGMFDFVVGSMRWSTRVSGWLYTLTDDYPPFTLKP